MGTIYTSDTRNQALEEDPYSLKPKQTENSIVGDFLDVIKETNGFVAVGYDFLGRGIFVKLNNNADITLMKIYSQGTLYGVHPDGSGGYVPVGQKTTTVGF